MHNEDVARLVLQAAGRCFLTSARELCAEAMILGSTDNVTALVIDLRYSKYATLYSHMSGVNN
jgi:serine/threonine protein phosphatase PrpC